METYLTALKDVLIVLAPIVIAYISYRGNKKTQKDIKYEVERITKEKEAETKQILEKIGAELESQKQLISWQNSLPQTNEYTNLLEPKRFGHISALPQLCRIMETILNESPSLETLDELDRMLDRIELPSDEDDLFPHEIPILLNYKRMRVRIKGCILSLKAEQPIQKEE